MDEALLRWRLVLGEASEGCLGGVGEGEAARVDAALDWLYGRDTEGDAPSGPRSAGSGASQLTVPDWINAIHELFPKRTIERLERDAVEVYGIAEIVTDPRVLEQVEPNPTLLSAEHWTSQQLQRIQGPPEPRLPMYHGTASNHVTRC